MSEYVAEQAKLDQQYTDEYRAWLDSMSPEEREQLKKMGLDRPDTSRQVLSSRSREDVATIAVAAPVIAKSPSDTLPREAIHDAISHISSVFVATDNVRLESIGLAFASGLSVCSLWGSQSNASRAFGWSRQHLNKSVSRWQRLLGLPPNAYTMPKNHKKKLSLVQTANHWRKKKYARTDSTKPTHTNL